MIDEHPALDIAQQTGRDSETHPYVLLTAAYNEESFITRVIESVIGQTQLPAKWIIVSDGSTDHTDEIVNTYCGKHDFIELLRAEKVSGRGTPSKVRALRLGFQRLKHLGYDFIGNLDADILLSPDYYEALRKKFEREPLLGIAGGVIVERRGRQFKSRISSNLSSVAHAAQLMRRECFGAMDGYRPLKYGGEDWCAEVSARMRGWTTKTFPELEVTHLRRTGGADPWFRHHFREGQADFSFGSDALFEVVKCLRRISERPPIFGAAARLTGFGWSYIASEEPLVPEPLVRFLRHEQRARLRQLFARPWRRLVMTILPSGR